MAMAFSKAPSRMAAVLSPFFSSSTSQPITTNSITSTAVTSSNCCCISGVPGLSCSRSATGLLSTTSTAVVGIRAPTISSASFSCSSIFGGRERAGGFGSTYKLAGGGCGARKGMATTNASSAAAPANVRSIHDFTVKDINGNEVNLSAYKGKVVLVVNVASACGLTNSNYTELAEVYGELKGAGLEILAFPCNQFGGQESGSNEQIKEFACTRFKAEYPIFDKIDVNGPNTAPVYQFLKASKGGGILGDSIKWNFGKFLVDQDGIVVERYAPTTSPKKITGDIKKLLGV